MITVDEALRQILDRFVPLPAESVAPGGALGHVLAEDVTALEDVPPFDNSAMDGFAVRSEDTRRAPVTSLRVVSTIAAGAFPSRALVGGEAARIMTGAPMPPGADAVIRFEETVARHHLGDNVPVILVSRPVEVGENVRMRGESARAGAIVLRAGDVVGPVEVGLLASVNVTSMQVHRRPRVGILSTGDELVEPGQPRRPGQVRNSNSSMLAALVSQAGGIPATLGTARDDAEDLSRRLSPDGGVDLIVSTGGVSVGDYDIVKDVLKAHGEIELWQVRMKPGRPLAFGAIGETPLLGLPGNPAAALVSFLQFGRPAIRRMLGHATLTLPEIPAVLAQSLDNPGGRRHYVRGVVVRNGSMLSVSSLDVSGSGVLGGPQRMNCFIVVPEAAGSLPEGTTATIQLLDDAPFGEQPAR